MLYPTSSAIISVNEPVVAPSEIAPHVPFYPHIVFVSTLPPRKGGKAGVPEDDTLRLPVLHRRTAGLSRTAQAAEIPSPPARLPRRGTGWQGGKSTPRNARRHTLGRLLIDGRRDGNGALRCVNDEKSAIPFRALARRHFRDRQVAPVTPDKKPVLPSLDDGAPQRCHSAGEL